MTNNNSNRTNTRIDNDFNRVVERARRNGAEPSVWQVIDTHNNWRIEYVGSTTHWERENIRTPGRFLFSPIFWRESGVDMNGNPVV